MSSLDRNYDEKRDFIRMQIDSKAFISCNGETQEGVCADLSSTGMQLKVENPISVGQQVEVEIVSQHNQLPSLKATASVIRVDHDEASGKYSLGLTIIKMN